MDPNDILPEITLDQLYDPHNLFMLDRESRKIILDTWTERMNGILESWSPEELFQADKHHTDSAG